MNPVVPSASRAVPGAGPMISRRRFLRKAVIACVMAGVGGTTAAYPFFIEPFWFTVKKIFLNPDPSFRFVFISDIHFSDIVTASYLEKAFNRIVSLDPDFVVIGGDYITSGSSRFLAELVPVMSTLARQVPTSRAILDDSIRKGKWDFTPLQKSYRMAGKGLGPAAKALVRLEALNFFNDLGARTYSFEEIGSWLRKAGFAGLKRVNLRKTPGFGLVLGTKAR